MLASSAGVIWRDSFCRITALILTPVGFKNTWVREVLMEWDSSLLASPLPPPHVAFENHNTEAEEV